MMSGDHLVGNSGGRDSSEMANMRRGLVAGSPSGLRQPPAEIDLFDVHKVPVVKSPYGFKGLTTNEQTSARHPVHNPGRGACPVRLSIVPAIAVLRGHHA
jgi:hypothetical protein